MEKRKIVVRKRLSDYIAYFEDSPAKWESGRDDIEALGKLVLSSLDNLGLYVYWYNEKGELV